MTDLDDRVRTMLQDRSRDVLIEPALPRAVAVRARRRRILIGACGGLAVLVAIVVGAAAVRSVVPEERVGSTSPTVSPTPVVSPWSGLWPQTSRADAEAAQAAVDAGEPGTRWQLDVGQVVRRYAVRELGFTEVHVDASIDLVREGEPGPFAIHVLSCEPRRSDEWPPVCAAGGGRYTEITVERLLRADRTGLWFVTGATDPAPAEEQTVPPLTAGYPETFVAVTNDGDLVLVRLADGGIERTLIEHAGELALGNGALTPDGSSVYVTDRSGRNPEILRVPLDGGPVESFAPGAVPTIGPDGRIAYGGCGRDGCASELVVEMPGGGFERVDVSPDEERLGELAWLPDGRIAFSVGYLRDELPDVRILDPADPPRYLLDLPLLGPSHPREAWRPIGYYRPTRGLAVDASCCPPPGELPLAEPILSIDLVTGEHGPGIVEGAGFSVSLDREGRWFLLLARAPDGTGGKLFLLDRVGQLREVGEGFLDVTW